MPPLKTRSKDEWNELCQTVKDSILPPIGSNAWEVVIAAALITSPEPQLLGQFYSHLSQHDPSFSTQESRKGLLLRLRDTILKLMTLVGAPQVLCALMPLAQAEGEPEEKAKTSSLNPKWAEIDLMSIHARGMQTIDTIYGHLLTKIFRSWGDHTQDLQFNEIFTVYGLYLSDFEVMTALETEAVVFTTICCTGLRGPSLWHTRGMGRLLGARGTNEDTDEMRKIKDVLGSLKVAMVSVVEWVGEDYVRKANIEAWVNAGDVLKELDGWGDDKKN